MLGEDGLRALVGGGEQGVDLRIDQLVDLLGEAGVLLAEALAQEDLVFGAQEHRAELVAHAVLSDHAAGDLGGLLDVAGRAGGDVAKDDGLGHASAHGAGHLGLHARGGHVAELLLGQIHGGAAGLGAGDGGDLMHLVALGDVVGDDGVAALVIGHQLAIQLGHALGALLRAGHDAGDGLLDGGHGDLRQVVARGEQRSLVHHVHQIRAGEVGGAAGQHLQIHVLAQGLVAGMHLQDLLATDHVGVVDHDAAVEAAGAQQGRVEHVAAVGGSKHDHALVVGKAVHLDEQLVQGLLALVVTAAQACAALAADRVDLIDEHDGGGVLLGLGEQVAHAACTHAHEHLDEV